MPQDVETTQLLGTLAERRDFLRRTVHGLTDEQAALTPTASELCLGGLIKHVAVQERQWVGFVVGGAEAMGAMDEAAYAAHAASFRMAPGDTLEALLADYEETARRTEEIVGGLASLDLAHALPEAPWFEPGAARSARQVLAHLIGETAQHAGHADILRETIDGARTMG